MSKNRWTAGIGKAGRIVAARIERGEDAIQSIIALIKEYGFRSGTVAGIGSLNSATVIYGKSTDLSKPLSEIAVTYKMEGPVDLGGGWGIFGTEEDGNIFLHFHAIILDKDGNMRCGNLIPGSAPVMATLDITIQEILELEIKPTLDPFLKAKMLNPMNPS